MLRCVQIHDVEIGCMRQGVAAKTPEAEHDQLTVREHPMRFFEFPRGSIAQRNQRPFGDPCVTFRHVQRIAAQVDQLHPERKPALIDQAPHAIERLIV
jgi:hypothetical protein